MKAAVTLLLAALIAMLAAFAAPAAMFKDVPKDSWILKALDQLEVEKFYFRYPDFPRSITRYEAAMATVRILEALWDEQTMERVDVDTALLILALLDEFKAELKDMDCSLRWYKPQIARLKAIVEPVSMFRDVRRDNWAWGAVSDLREAGLVEGYPTGHRHISFTRYEFAMVVARIWNKLEDEGMMNLVDEDTALQLLGLTTEFRRELTEIGVDMNVLKPQIARLADEKLFIPLIGE